MAGKSWAALLRETFDRWNDHQAIRLSAAVAFYTLLSIAPLLIFVTAIIAIFLSKQAAQVSLISEANSIVGSRGGELVRGLLANGNYRSSGVFPSVIALITLLFGASGVFSELRDAMNTIWDAKPKGPTGWQGMIVQRLFSFGMVLSVGFLLLVSLLLSTALSFVGKYFGSLVPVPAGLLELANFLFSFAIVTFLFGLIFKFVPAVKISWRDVIVGAVGTALLFTIGKFFLGLYLGKASVGSAYGAAGSVVALIVWVYYSAQIFFFGAEFTRIYADERARQTKGVTAKPTSTAASAPNAFKANA